MINVLTTTHDARPYDQVVAHIELLIEKATTYLRSNTAVLQELADDIGRESERIDYQRGKGYAQFFAGSALQGNARYEESLPYYSAALDFFTAVQDMEGTRITFRYLGLAHHRLCRYEWALNYYRQELGILERFFESDIIGIAGTISNIASVYLIIGQPDVALGQYMYAMNLLENHQDNRAYPTILLNIANLHLNLGELDQALEYQYNALEIYQKTQDLNGEATTLMAIGSNNNRRGQYDEALLCGTRALAMFEEQGNVRKVAIARTYIGRTYLKLQQYGEARKFLEASYAISSEIGDRKNCMDVLQEMGELAMEQKHGAEAKDYYMQALVMAQELGTGQTEYEIYEKLAQAESKTGNAEAALRYYQEYIRVKEKVLNERRLQAISEMQVRFNAEQTEREKEIYRLKNVELADALHKVELLNRDLTTANNEKNELMGIVAHDLKNPITGLSMVLSLIENHWSRMSGEDVLYQLSRMKRTVSRMEHIVGKLLDVNQLESGGMAVTPIAFNLADVVRTVVDDYDIRLTEKGIKMDCHLPDRPLYVYADPELTTDVLDNLVSNAIKYSPHHSQVLVSVERTPDAVRVRVQDSGPGIAPEDIHKLFRKFVRLDARPTGGESSTGLGLSIVKKLVDSMNGTVWCESEVGKGAAFIVELPQSTEHSPT